MALETLTPPGQQVMRKNVPSATIGRNPVPLDPRTHSNNEIAEIVWVNSVTGQ